MDRLGEFAAANQLVDRFNMMARTLTLLCAATGLAGCAISPGPETTEAKMCNVPRTYLEVEAHDGDTRRAAATDSFAKQLEAAYSDDATPVASSGEPVTPSMLFMSGGSQNGAFGAGVLEGWSQTRPGRLPRFKVVTGISTGAIMATHAFLDRADAVAENYRITREGEVLQSFVKAGSSSLQTAATVLRKGAVGDLAPMRKMLGDAITEQVLLDVASEAKLANRKLYIGAVDLDLGKAVIFDMTALAERFPAADQLGRQRIRDCYLDAILASSVVPVAALPVFIDNRMYIDGGARFGIISDEIDKAATRIFAASSLPGTPPTGGTTAAKPNVFTIVNGTLEVATNCGKADPATCDPNQPDSPLGAHAKWRVPDLAQRSVSILISQVYRFSNDRIENSASDRGFDYHLLRLDSEAGAFPATIRHPAAGSEIKTCADWEKDDVRLDKPLEFHARYMHCLVAYGGHRARQKKWACKEPIDPQASPDKTMQWREFCRA